MTADVGIPLRDRIRAHGNRSLGFRAPPDAGFHSRLSTCVPDECGEALHGIPREALADGLPDMLSGVIDVRHLEGEATGRRKVRITHVAAPVLAAAGEAIVTSFLTPPVPPPVVRECYVVANPSAALCQREALALRAAIGRAPDQDLVRWTPRAVRLHAATERWESLHRRLALFIAEPGEASEQDEGR